MPSIALDSAMSPSFSKGIVTTATVRMPLSFAILAICALVACGQSGKGYSIVGTAEGTEEGDTVRKGDTILYLKQNEQICDALTFFGAPNASMSLVEQQIYKSFRSQTNRRMNCDLANIDKTIAAGAQQVQDIELIRRTIGLDALPETLQEIAVVRLQDPEASLTDLGAQCNPPLTRSGVHHRLHRISEIAKKLSEQ